MSTPDVTREQFAWTVPAPLTPLVGRRRELASIVAALRQEETRLLTVTGPGGVGKTRLAQEVAGELGRSLRDGAVFIDLTATTDPDMVIPMIAYSLGVTVRDTRFLDEQLAHELADRRLLLVLDNFEHLISAGVRIANFLVHCPGVKALVTSQMPLHVRGEHEVSLAPLDFPAELTHQDIAELEQVDAVQLFIQRAQAVQPRFRLTEDNAEYVAEICRRLDGLPLAIELAAVRIKVFPVKALHARLADRMSLLTGGARDLPERLQTMRNAILWSYDLLAPDEQALFRALSVFQGAFTLEAAAAVSDWESYRAVHEAVDFVDAIASLVDKSMLVREVERDGDARFRLLETIREFGSEQASRTGEGPALARRHLHYYASTAPGEIELAGPNQAELLNRIDEDLPNIRYGLQTALNFGGEAAVEGLVLASSMWRYWMSRGQFIAGRYWLTSLLERTNDGHLMVRGRAENNLGNLVLELGEYEAAQASYQRAMELYESAGYADGVGDELNNLGLIRVFEGDYVAARELMERSLAIRDRTGDWTSVPTTLSNLGELSMLEGDIERGTELHLEAHRIRVELGNDRGVALSCYQLGNIAILNLDWDEARRWFEQGMRIADRIDDAYSRACLRLGFGYLLVHERTFIPAVEALRSAVLTFSEMSARRMLIEAIYGVGYCAVPFGHDQTALELMSACHAFREQNPLNLMPRRAAWIDAFDVRLRTRLGDAAAERAERTGREYTIDEAVAAALGLLDRVASDAATRADETVAAADDAERPDIDLPSLTNRQLEVLRLLALGRTDKEIAEELSISPRTAMTHVANILGRLKVNRRSAASSIAIRAGLIPAPGMEDDD